MTRDISSSFNLRQTDGNNADYVRTGKLFALNADQADEAILILTRKLDPRGRRPYTLYLDRSSLGDGQHQRIEDAIALHTSRRVLAVNLSQPETASASDELSPLARARKLRDEFLTFIKTAPPPDDEGRERELVPAHADEPRGGNNPPDGKPCTGRDQVEDAHLRQARKIQQQFTGRHRTFGRDFDREI